MADPPAPPILLRSRLIAASPVHYGWMILAAGTLGTFMTMPGQTVGVSLFFEPITAELNLSRTQASLAYALGTLAGLLPAPLIGRWIDRKGPRWAATLISAGLVLACAFMAAIQSQLTLILGFAMLRGAAVGGLSLVSQHVVNLWFVRRRGIASAGASLGLAAGAMVFPQVIHALIEAFGWRGAYLGLACIVALTILPVAAAIFRDRPERFGLLPDAGRAVDPARPAERSYTRGEALRTGVFWLLCAASFLSNGIGTGLLLNHFSIMELAGLERAAALRLLAPLAGFQVLATLVIGALMDWVEPRWLIPVPMMCLAIGTTLAVFGGGSAFGWLYALSTGLALGATQAIHAAAYAQYFGRDHLGAIRGVSYLFGIGGAAFGPLPFAAGLALTGEYTAVLVVSGTLCLACAAASGLVRRPSD
jgi:MFS family permease